MREISNSAIWVYKKLLPLGWFIIFGIVALAGYIVPDLSAAVCGTLFVGFGVIFFRVYYWPLPDHVYLADAEIVLDKSGAETRIPLGDVKNVGYDPKLRMVVLTLRDRRDVRFLPHLSFLPYSVFPSPPEVVGDLIEAIDKYRNG